VTDGSGIKRALVTGGAGLIGSHLSDLLLGEGYRVRILDNLEPQTHRNGKPPWIPTEAEFVNADIRDRASVRGGAGGYRRRLPPGGLRRLHAGDGQVRTRKQLRHRPDARAHPRRKPPSKKVVVASSQAVYREGAASCPEHGLVYPETRPVEQLAVRGLPPRIVPLCGKATTPTPTPEERPDGGRDGSRHHEGSDQEQWY
jgi:dTDP-L-rhamnose 4-epimerase